MLFSYNLLLKSVIYIVGYTSKLYFNETKPDGTLVKLTDPSKYMPLAWKHKIEHEEGIRIIYQWYLNHLKENN